MKQNRNRLISFLQAYGILLVVVGHSFVGYAGVHPLYRWIYSFHMPLFMFISGYLLLYTTRRQGRSLSDIRWFGGARHTPERHSVESIPESTVRPRQGFLWKKTRRLLVPYVLISTLAFLPKVWLSRYAVHPVELSWTAWGEMLLYPTRNVIIFFWFLPTLFLILCVTVGSAKIMAWLRNSRAAVKALGNRLQHYEALWQILLLFGLLALSCFNPLREVLLLNLAGVGTYLFYFVLGMTYCRWQEAVDRALRIRSLGTLLLLLALSIGLSHAEEGPLRILATLAGIACSLSLGAQYVRRQWHFMDHLDGSTYTIYLLSWFPQAACQQLLGSVWPLGWQAAAVLSTVTGMYLPWLVYRWSRHLNPQRIFGRLVYLLLGLPTGERQATPRA